LMDEPFSALDPLIRTHLQDELLDLQRKLRRTIVFVSHDLDEALKIGTHIAIMEGGRIVQHGPPQDIVLNPANDYVAAFVQHMNPLNVLTGDVMMTPLPTLKRIGPMLVLDDDLGLTLAVNNAGAAERAALGEHQLKVFESNGEASSWPRGEVVVMPHSAPMRVVIDARRQSGLPILLAQDGRIIGVVRDDDIYSGLLARATAQAHSPA
jgi:glycine betaine/proline transport system ATP-binding protein